MLCLPFLCSGGLEMAWHPCFLPTQTSFYPPFLSSLLPSAEEMLERALYGLEMAWHLYQWGDGVEVITPPQLRILVEAHRRSDFPALP